MTRPADGAQARAAAARAIHAVLNDGCNLDAALEANRDSLADERQAAQVQALAYGSLRWHGRHRELLGLLLDRPLRRRDRILEALLSVGMFQVLGTVTPDHAAVSATVAAARQLGQPRAAGMVNATLRRLIREREALLAQAMSSDEGRYAHPRWLIDAIRTDWPDHWQAILESGQHQGPMWLRVNAAIRSREAAMAQLAGGGVSASVESGFTDALRLDNPQPVQSLPGFTAGELSVQDAAAQLAAPLLAPVPGERVLDACAAPGGKTLHLLERAAGRLDLLALDIDPQRLQRVAANLQRGGYQASLLEADAESPAEWWDGKAFDAILLDAPCSATGVIRRHPDIRFLRRPGDIPAMAARQARLLDRLWPLLRPGGRLLYATCSVLRAENQAVIDAFLDRSPGAKLRMPTDVPPAVHSAAGYGWQLLPGSGDTDGFYYALIVRDDS